MCKNVRKKFVSTAVNWSWKIQNLNGKYLTKEVNAQLLDEAKQLQANKITMYEDGKYTDDV